MDGLFRPPSRRESIGAIGVILRFLGRAQPALVASPVVHAAAASPQARWTGPVAYAPGPETVAGREDEWSPSWLGVVAVAAAAGAAVRPKPAKKYTRGSVADGRIA